MVYMGRHISAIQLIKNWLPLSLLHYHSLTLYQSPFHWLAWSIQNSTVQDVQINYWHWTQSSCSQSWYRPTFDSSQQHEYYPFIKDDSVGLAGLSQLTLRLILFSSLESPFLSDLCCQTEEKKKLIYHSQSSGPSSTPTQVDANTVIISSCRRCRRRRSTQFELKSSFEEETILVHLFSFHGTSIFFGKPRTLSSIVRRSTP